MPKHRMPTLLEKLVMQWDGIHGEYGAPLRYVPDYQKRLSIIRKVLVREKGLFAGRKVSGRIVGIDRHYVRPVVRGKETKPVESGAKVEKHAGRRNILHRARPVQGIQWGHTPEKVYPYVAEAYEVRARCVVADSFVRKGRTAGDGQSGKVSESELSKERAIRLGGGFGTHKRHYPLSRTKARNRRTDILWTFFRIHAANTVQMTDKSKEDSTRRHDMALQAESEEGIGLLSEHHGRIDENLSTIQEIYN